MLASMLLAATASPALWLLAWSGYGLEKRYHRPRNLAPAFCAAACAAVAALLALAQLAVAAPRTAAVDGWAGQLLSVRLDSLSLTMLLLVNFVGLIVVRYSHHYLAGNRRQLFFLRQLCLTVGAVSVLVIAGNVVLFLAAWVGTSLSLHRLLLFNGERPHARSAAQRKFVVARASDLALAAALTLLALRAGTTDIADIASIAAGAADAALADLTAPAMLLVLAALLKSAQFPTHSWLPQAIDAPTPVSALLHAGIVNGGGFLIIRFADVVSACAPALYLLLFVGGITALYGSLVMLTQRSIKGALAYSTVAQMGFMLLQCGLGAYSSAILHIVAHSLYKAHAFLSSGSVVDIVRTYGPQSDVDSVRPGPVIASLAVALTVFALVSTGLGITLDSKPAIVGLGAILVFSTMHLVIQSSREGRWLPAFLRSSISASLVVALYFTLQAGAALAYEGVVPPAGGLDPIQQLMMALMLITFAVVTALQWYLPTAMHRARWRSLWVHLSNGLYVDQALNQLLHSNRKRAPAQP